VLGEAGRAPLVGRRTFGRVGVQKAIPLYEGGLVLTVAKYVTPEGKAIHEQGVEPTVPVARDDEDETGTGAKAAPARDPVLDKALEVLKAGERKAADLSGALSVLRCRAGKGVRPGPALPA
jgi:carboxyl-terminal processing protease